MSFSHFPRFHFHNKRQLLFGRKNHSCVVETRCRILNLNGVVLRLFCLLFHSLHLFFFLNLFFSIYLPYPTLFTLSSIFLLIPSLNLYYFSSPFLKCFPNWVVPSGWRTSEMVSWDQKMMKIPEIWRLLGWEQFLFIHHHNKI